MNGTYTEYPELGIVKFEGNNGNTLTLNCKFISGKSCMTLNDTEKVARWSINNGNELGYNLLEQVVKARMKYNVKANGGI